MAFQGLAGIRRVPVSWVSFALDSETVAGVGYV